MMSVFYCMTCEKRGKLYVWDDETIVMMRLERALISIAAYLSAQYYYRDVRLFMLQIIFAQCELHRRGWLVTKYGCGGGSLW